MRGAQMKIRSSYKYLIFKISDDKKFIEIEHKGEPGATFEDFCGKLPEASCRYAVLDVEINTKSGATTNKLMCARARARAPSALHGAAHAQAAPPSSL